VAKLHASETVELAWKAGADTSAVDGSHRKIIMKPPKVELIMVVTAHHKGMGKMLKTAPQRILPFFPAKSPAHP